MAGDLIKPVRRATLTHLKADAAVTALLPPSSIHAAKTPLNRPWPFSRLDTFVSVPFGNGVSPFRRHGDVPRPRVRQGNGGHDGGGSLHRYRLGVQCALHNRRLAIPGGSMLMVVRSSEFVPDASEADIAHSVLSIEARAIVDA